MSYSVKRITDREIVESFVFDDDLWERSSEDGSPKEISDLYLYAPQCYYLLVNHGGSNVGLMVCHEGMSKVVEVHIKVKNKDRKQHAKMVGFICLKWLMMNTEYNKVITWVPSIYPHVRNFCKRKFGFTEEGCNRRSFLKNGEMIDMFLYGLTREEIEVMICQ